jgi:hypothetical protein
MERLKEKDKPLPVPQKLFRRAVAARVLGPSVTMIKNLEKEGRLKPIVLGLRHVFYTAEEVEALAKPPHKASKRTRK